MVYVLVENPHLRLTVSHIPRKMVFEKNFAFERHFRPNVSMEGIGRKSYLSVPFWEEKGILTCSPGAAWDKGISDLVP